MGTFEDKEHYELMNKEYKNEFVTIDNSIVRAREKTNLLESKIEILAIHHLDKSSKQKEKLDDYGNPYVVNYVQLSAKEIKQLMGRDDGDAYTDIRHAAFALKQKMLIVENKETRQFILRSMYGDVMYDNGSLYIEFNPGVQDLFLDMKEKFTKLSLPIMFSFKKNGGFQLYKVLKSYAFSPNLPQIDMSMEQEELPSYRVSYDVIDLRMTLGYIDLDQDKLKEEARKKNPNFVKMAKEEKNPQYKRWSDFNNRVIEPGINEINEISDIYIAKVVKNTMGRGGKVTSIDFYIQHNKEYYKRKGNTISETANVTEKSVSEEEKIAVQDWLEDKFYEKNFTLRAKQIRPICEIANYDRDKLTKALDVLSKTSNVYSVVGFMVKAIKEDWEVPTEIKNEKKSFANFTQRGSSMTEKDRKRYFELFEKILVKEELNSEEKEEYNKLESLYNKK